MNKKDFKIVVIGSGPGGCVPAVMFAEKGLDVLMIEAGSNFSNKFVDEYSSSELNLKYRNAGLTAAIGNPIINYAEGNCVGGGSEINSGLFHEIPDQVLKKWELKNNITFNRNDLKNAYSEIKKSINVSFMPENKIPEASLLLKNTSDKLGWECNEIPRWYKYNSDGSSKKQSMSETYIPRFIDAGGKLLTNATVDLIKKQNNRNTVNVLLEDGSQDIYTCDYLFIACGSIHSPFLLLKSGIKKNIGKGLKMHPSFKFTAIFDKAVNKDDMGVPVHQVKEFSPEISIGCSISNKPFLGISLNETNNLELIENWKNMATYYSMICPKGQGKVTKLPFFKSPFVTFNLSKEDKDNLRKSILLLGNLLFEAGAIKLFPSSNSREISSIDELKTFEEMPISKLNLMTIHLFSSIQMGGNKNLHPVTSEGCLREDDSIYISDGSILCDSPSVNPQGTIMALTHLNALNFIERIKNEI
tara:strand:+ start:377 stop:1792 length:1416 start_codon:yes stop_codon:yes gene_type:complete